MAAPNHADIDTGTPLSSGGRYPLAERSSLPDDSRDAILAVQEKAGFVACHDALMLREEGSLTKGDREMIVIATSAAHRRLYCVVAHGALSRIHEKKPLVADRVAVDYLKADFAALHARHAAQCRVLPAGPVAAREEVTRQLQAAGPRQCAKASSAGL